MLSNRPLFATAADANWFVWTRAAIQLRNALVLHRNTLLIGEHGSGKTSTLHMVEHYLREEKRLDIAFVSLAGLEDPADVVLAVHAAAVERNWVHALVAETARSITEAGDPLAPVRLVRQLRDAPRNAIFLLDDVGSAAGAALFGRLRDELWQLDCVWAAAILPDDAGPLVRPPADAFFERRVTLGELETQERLELLRARIERRRDRLTVQRARELAAHGPGNPRQLIELARDASSRNVTPAALSEASGRRAAAAVRAVGKSGAQLVTAMQGLGPVSASDPRLLDRLGWDRPRAARVLARLERDRIVRSYLEPREGRIGRPRKLYELMPADEFITS